MSKRASTPWPTWVRWLVLSAGLAASAAGGYLTALVVTFAAIVAGAAPLGLVGETTPQQPWVTPVAVGAGLVVLGLGAHRSVAMFRRHRELRAHAPTTS